VITRALVEGSAPFVCTWLGLQALATAGHVSASTQNQALSAPIFLYEVVLRVPLDRLADLVPARRPTRIPVVLSRDEVDALGRLRGSVVADVRRRTAHHGVRRVACEGRRHTGVRDGKGRKDRVTVLPGRVTGPLVEHLRRVRRWQWVFPATRTCALRQWRQA